MACVVVPIPYGKIFLKLNKEIPDFGQKLYIFFLEKCKCIGVFKLLYKVCQRLEPLSYLELPYEIRKFQIAHDEDL